MHKEGGIDHQQSIGHIADSYLPLNPTPGMADEATFPPTALPLPKLSAGSVKTGCCFSKHSGRPSEPIQFRYPQAALIKVARSRRDNTSVNSRQSFSCGIIVPV